MVFDDGIGFAKPIKTSSKCRTFDSSSPPEFGDNEIIFHESRTGSRMKIEGRIEGFKQNKDGNYKVRICKK